MRRMKEWLIECMYFVISVKISWVNGHGRLIEPPSRASMWRYGFKTPPNYGDHELYCGGLTRQHARNGGKCGICGDPWDAPEPRQHEAGGPYANGIIVRKYKAGSSFTIGVEVTANHRGHFEFRVCPNNDPKKEATQKCLDKYVLKRAKATSNDPSELIQSHETWYYAGNESKTYKMKYLLPKGLTCSQCVLQWKYIAANNWGVCSNGTGRTGCGPQEEFRACADIAIADSEGNFGSGGGTFGTGEGNFGTGGGTFGTGGGTFGTGEATFGSGEGTFGTGEGTFGSGEGTFGSGEGTIGTGGSTFGTGGIVPYKVTSGGFKEVSYKPPSGSIKEISYKLPIGSTKEVPYKITSGATKKVPYKLSSGFTKEVPYKLSSGFTKEVSYKLSSGVTKEVPYKISNGATKEVPTKLSSGVTKVVLYKIPTGSTKEVPYKLPKTTKQLPTSNKQSSSNSRNRFDCGGILDWFGFLDQRNCQPPKQFRTSQTPKQRPRKKGFRPAFG